MKDSFLLCMLLSENLCLYRYIQHIMIIMGSLVVQLVADLIPLLGININYPRSTLGGVEDSTDICFTTAYIKKK